MQGGLPSEQSGRPRRGSYHNATMKLLSGLLLAVAALSAVSAAPVTTQELADLAAQGYRLLDLQEGAAPVWKTEKEKLELLRANVHFVSMLYTITKRVTHLT